ncbi:MAG: hypothetical protein UW69_C0001G0025 [Microgenomates group bacterium GW2011_GWA2_44_7]|nr:MAG: hypothetical protein UW69_C0001G0025 [Microgenomates group bacterium GW2011_GWA2_44_7]KKT78408.1 MAG: hypothetical protein UW73_C0003G0056 [Microgenomates group bacterium GW2011_GWB1_44_8]
MLKVFKKINPIFHPLILIIIFSIPTVYALTASGFYGASDDIHIAWLYEMTQTLKNGQFPPRYVPDLSFGFGYPLFNFVFPFPYYLGALFYFIGFSLVASTKIVFGLSIVLSGLAMYWLLRQILGRIYAVVGGVIYIYTPYRAIDIYYRGDIGESVAFIFFPLVLLAVYQLTVCRVCHRRWYGVGSLGLAGLILSHNIAAYMFVPLLILFSTIRILSNPTDIFRQAVKVMFMFVLGLAGAVYFWLPAILDSQLVKYDTVYNYVDHFPSLLQLLAPYSTSKLAAPDPYGNQSYYLGTLGIILLIFSSVFFIRRYKQISGDRNMLYLWALISIALSIFMMNFRSDIIWKSLPFLPYFQFPWRFLMLTTLLFPFLLIPLSQIPHKVIPLVLIISAILTTYQLFRPHDFLSRGDDYYLNRYIPMPKASEEYKLTKEEYLRLLKLTDVRPDRNYQLFFANEGVEQINGDQLLNVSVETNSPFPFILNIRRYTFPGWKAYIDGNQTTLGAGRPFGQLSLLIPAGQHNVQIKFKETDFKLILDMISLFAMGLSLVFILDSRKNV